MVHPVSTAWAFNFRMRQSALHTAACFVIFAAFTGNANAQSADLRSSIEPKLELLRRNAMVAWQKKDVATLKATMAPDFLFVGPQGVMQRDGWLAALSHCSLANYSMNQVQLHEISSGAAVLIYKLHHVGDCDGKPSQSESIVTDTFVQRNEKWWIVNTSFIPQQN